jgi:four helix bundle protein
VSESRPTTRSFTDVTVWKKAHLWVLSAYRFTESFPEREQFGLTAQLRRAAISIPASFAGGFKQYDPAEMARCYSNAQGSLEECRYYLILANDLGYGETHDLLRSLEEVSRMLDGYIRATVARGG